MTFPTAKAGGLLFSTGTPCLGPRLGATAGSRRLDTAGSRLGGQSFCFLSPGEARRSDPRPRTGWQPWAMVLVAATRAVAVVPGERRSELLSSVVSPRPQGQNFCPSVV